MLRFVFTDIFDYEIEKTKPLSVSINMEENVPADDMSVVFEHFECNELKDVRVYDGDNVIFTGVVDEQQCICTENSQYIKIVARSMAALLLDNESVPISYTHPSVSTIASRHIYPFDLKLKDAKDETLFSQLTVLKGDSNYQAVESFSKKLFSKTPRVNSRGEVDFNGVRNDKEVVFSNTGDGIRYEKFRRNIKRCEEISTVRIKVTNSSGYHSVIENENAVSRGITRERYLNAVLTETPASYAKRMIENSKKKSYFVMLECAGRYLDIFGCNAKVKGSICGDLEDLYISKLSYSLTDKKETTKITLYRKEV